MRVEDFPRPKDDNGRGVHWSATVYHPTGAALDYWITELQAMHIKWVKPMDDGGGSSLELCRRLLAADIMPIVRLYRKEPNPGTIGGREEDTARRLIAAGVRYFETNNEPDLPAEWKGGHMPPNALEVVIDNFIVDADKIIGMGGLPALPAMGVGSKDNPVAIVVAKGRADLFEKGAWVAIHNYTLNHPLDYPYDSVNQEGTPVSQEEYDRLGSWAWEGRPREQINAWRASDKNPGATLEQDATCFLAFHLADQMIRQTLGYPVPIISTEGGPVVGWKDDHRYPRLDPHTHAEWVVGINDFMQGGRQIHGLDCPDSYFTVCHWLIGNYRLGFMAPGWESQSWYSDWWNQDFDLHGELPVVAAVKAMPNGDRAIIAGQLLRADTLEPASDLTVNALSGAAVAATAATAADGTFRLERLAPGIYDLAVTPWGIVRHGVTATVAPAAPVVIRLAGGCNSVLSGKVQDPAGQPQAAVQVTLQRDGAVIGAMTTAADGAFRFEGLALGVYRLAIPACTVAGLALDGWKSRSLKLTTGGATPIYHYAVTTRRLLGEAETASRRIFFGTVVGADGAGINGVKIEMSWRGAEGGTQFPTTTSGRDPYKPKGYYEFINSAGNFALRVTQGDWPSETAADLETANVPGRAGKPIAYEVNFALQAAGATARVDGSIAGAPAGRKLKLIGQAAERETALAADGAFAFDNVAPGAYRLELAGVGVIAEDIAVAAGGLFKLIFPMRSKLSGQVIAPSDGLLAVLHAPLAWGWTRQMPLDPTGAFAFEGLPPGAYRLEIGDQTLPDLALTGENTLQLPAIDLGGHSIIRGRVTDFARPSGVDVLMTLRRDGLIAAQIRTAADGTYRFANLSAGTYALEAAGRGEVAGGIALDGQNEQVRDIFLGGDLPPRGRIQGRVLTADGQPQNDVTVRLLRDAAETARTQADATAAFSFTELAASVYALAVGDGAPLVTDIRLAENAIVTADITLPAPRKLLAHYLLFGQTTDDGRPTTNAETKLALALAAEYLRRTGASGGFSVGDASQAAQVTIVGDTVSAADEQALTSAGCQVRRLEGDGYAVAAAFEQLLAQLGEG
ncbi:MAG: carboxypeptidase regulatory-like domain-containing protein [Chloroflexi bacterium]|nr:carboxypeptidase regulatory-like domain-containing protein [Chloroflexota bacterium]